MQFALLLADAALMTWKLQAHIKQRLNISFFLIIIVFCFPLSIQNGVRPIRKAGSKNRKGDNSMNTINIEEVKAALAITSVSFKKWIEGGAQHNNGKPLEKGTAEYAAQRQVYNQAQDIVNKAAKEGMESTKARITVSALRSDKHRVKTVSGMKEGSVIREIAEQEREEKSRLFFESRKEGKISLESGLTDKDYILLAKHNSLVPDRWKETNDAGNKVFTKSGCEAWLKFYNQELITAREAAGQEVLKDMITPVPAVRTKKAKAS